LTGAPCCTSSAAGFALVAQLAETGITAAGFPADVGNRDSLTAALEQAASQFGPIDVLKYSPYSGLVAVHPPEVTVDNLRPEIEHLLFGAVNATQAVLPSATTSSGAHIHRHPGRGAFRHHHRRRNRCQERPKQDALRPPMTRSTGALVWSPAR